MSEKAITLNDIPVIKELVEDTIDEKTAPIKTDIDQITPRILPPNAKVVYCDGDHDELKIQAAIEAIKDTGGVVYPVGECVITVENTVPATEENAVMLSKNTYALNTSSSSIRPNSASVRLYKNTTIDGQFCNGLTLLVTNSSYQARITFIAAPYGGTIRHIDITMVCTDGLEKKCPFTLVGEKVNIENCTFNNIIGSNSSLSSGMAYGSLVLLNSTIQDVVINSPFARGTNSNSRFMRLQGCNIRNMEYINSTPVEARTYSKGVIYISGDIDGVAFKDSELYQLEISGDVRAGNITLKNLSADWDITMTNIDSAVLQDIAANARFILTDVSNITGDNITARLESYLFKKIENVWMTNLSVTGSPSGCAFYADDSIITNSKFFMRPEQSGIENMPLIRLEDDSDSTVIIKNNITNVVTLTNGGLKTRSIINDNITASAMLAGQVTLSSNQEGFIEGAKITATAADGEVPNANVSSIGKAAYLWQKSADGTTWETVRVGTNSYTLAGDEGYIRCGVYDGLGYYAGAVYSDAYAVTATETTGTEE